MLLLFHAGAGDRALRLSNWMPTFLMHQGIALAASLDILARLPADAVGPLLAMTFADRFERKWQIVAAALLVAGAGLVFTRRARPGLSSCMAPSSRSARR